MLKKIIMGLVVVFALSVASAMTPTKVTFINQKPGTILGLAKFTEFNDKGEPTDYRVMNFKWDDPVKTIYLLPGMYGVTQYMPGYISWNGVKVRSKITGYQSFSVKEDQPQKIIMY